MNLESQLERALLHGRRSKRKPPAGRTIGLRDHGGDLGDFVQRLQGGDGDLWGPEE